MVMGGSTCFVAMLVSYGYIKYRSIKDREKFRKYVRQGNLDPENVESNENTLRLEEEVSRMVVVMMISFTILNLPSKSFLKIFNNGSILGMGSSTCLLDARSVLGVFDGAWARVLESEHMLVLARARGFMLEEYSASIKVSRM